MYEGKKDNIRGTVSDVRDTLGFKNMQWRRIKFGVHGKMGYKWLWDWNWGPWWMTEVCPGVLTIFSLSVTNVSLVHGEEHRYFLHCWVQSWDILGTLKKVPALPEEEARQCKKELDSELAFWVFYIKILIMSKEMPLLGYHLLSLNTMPLCKHTFHISNSNV